MPTRGTKTRQAFEHKIPRWKEQALKQSTSVTELTPVCWTGNVNCLDNEIKGTWYLSSDIGKEGQAELGKAAQGGTGRH